MSSWLCYLAVVVQSKFPCIPSIFFYDKKVCVCYRFYNFIDFGTFFLLSISLSVFLLAWFSFLNIGQNKRFIWSGMELNESNKCARHYLIIIDDDNNNVINCWDEFQYCCLQYLLILPVSIPNENTVSKFHTVKKEKEFNRKKNGSSLAAGVPYGNDYLAIDNLLLKKESRNKNSTEILPYWG